MTEQTQETATSGAFSRRKKLLILGGVMAAIGIALLSVGAYLTLSGGESGPADELVVDLGNEDPFDINEYLRPDVLPPSATPLATLGPPPLGDSGYTMVIEKIGVNAPVQTYGLDKNSVPIVPTGSDAAGIVAWYDFSARPGTGSNAVFAGHVTWNGRGVFYDLEDLKAGDIVRLKAADGTEVVYSVSAVFPVDPHDPDSLKVMHHTTTDVLTIITCSGKFSYNSDPVFGGEYDSRLIVRADLVSVTGPAQASSGR